MGAELRVAYLIPGSQAWLEQAVTISLFTNARLPGVDPVPDGGDDRGGHWGDVWLPGDESLGSLLWTLRREKLTPPIIGLARDYADAALQWMLTTDYVIDLLVEVEQYQPVGAVASSRWTLAMRITLTLPDQTTLTSTEFFDVT